MVVLGWIFVVLNALSGIFGAYVYYTHHHLLNLIIFPINLIVAVWLASVIVSYRRYNG